jgi:hypothetical protein
MKMSMEFYGSRAGLMVLLLFESKTTISSIEAHVTVQCIKMSKRKNQMGVLFMTCQCLISVVLRISAFSTLRVPHGT